MSGLSRLRRRTSVLGVVFAALVVAAGGADPGLVRTIGVDLAYGIGIRAVFAVLVMPIRLSAVGFGMAPDVPNVAIEILVGYAAYGLVLGAVDAALE